MKSLSGTGDDEAILSQRRHVTNQIIGQLYQAEVIGPVSYTHLDVYKRQPFISTDMGVGATRPT